MSQFTITLKRKKAVSHLFNNFLLKYKMENGKWRKYKETMKLLTKLCTDGWIIYKFHRFISLCFVLLQLIFKKLCIIYHRALFNISRDYRYRYFRIYFNCGNFPNDIYSCWGYISVIWSIFIFYQGLYIYNSCFD